MVGWHHGLNGHEFEQVPRDGKGQGSRACCSPWGHKELDMTQQLKKQQVLQIVITQSLLYPSEINTSLCNYNVPLLSFLTTMFQLFSAFYLMETTSCSIIPFTSDFQHSNTFISFPVKVKVAQSCPTLCNPMSTEVSRPEYWSGQPFSFPGDLPNPGIEPRSPTLQVDFLPAEPQGKSISFPQQPRYHGSSFKLIYL